MDIAMIGSSKGTDERPCVTGKPLTRLDRLEDGVQIEIDGQSPDSKKSGEVRKCRYVVRLTSAEVVSLLFELGDQLTQEVLEDAFKIGCTLPEERNQRRGRAIESVSSLIGNCLNRMR